MKRHAPATARNTSSIVEVLALELPESGTVLEVASGSGEHAIAFAREFPDLIWQPSDPDSDALASITAWSEEEALANIQSPIEIDAAATWPELHCDAIFCCNMVHISPWEATEGLFRNAGERLGRSAPLILYGPYVEDDVPTAPSNMQFDQSLRARNPTWGIRNVAALDELALRFGLARTKRYAMPANNLMLIYRA
jgi:hypothetical protein